jgi:zinc-ribbon domain
MFCPNCGNQAAGDQKFCRSCGMNLGAVSTAVAEHHGESGPGEFQIEPANDVRPPSVWGVLLGFMVILAGVALSVIGKLFIHDAQIRGVGAMVSIIGMFLTAYCCMSAAFKFTAAGRRPSWGPKLYEAKTTSRLPQETAAEKLADAPSSIADKTTGLLPGASIQPTGQPAEHNRSGELKG